ncbi:MAG: TonB-dependent receptor, partial [Chitinophagaceae bacterium]
MSNPNFQLSINLSGFAKLYLIPIFLLTMSIGFSQTTTVTVSGLVKENTTKAVVSYANVALKKIIDSSFILGTITNEEGRFSMANIKSGDYYLEISSVGFQIKTMAALVGQLSSFLDLGTIELIKESKTLAGITVTAITEKGVSDRMDKKVFTVADNVSQSGGSVLQAMNNLPGVTTSQDGKVQLRGSDKVAVLIDGKQTALTGFGGQTGLDNIPASAIERIEIINNPSARYDANGNAGIIN